MISAIQKARAFTNDVASRQTAAGARRVFGPPPGGSAYYGGQAYRYQQVTEAYRHWSCIAIGAYMREIAGGDPPELGALVRKDELRDRELKRKAIKGGLNDRDGRDVRRWLKRKAWSEKRWVRKNLGIPEDHEFEAFDHDDPMCRVFSNPNGPDVAYDLWAYTVLFHLLCGYVVLWVRRNVAGVPVEIWPIPTHWIQMLRCDADGQPDAYIVLNPWGRVNEFPYDECVVLQEHSPLSRWEGYAISIAIGEWLDTYESLVRSRLAQFKNGAVPNIHISLGETYADPGEEFLNRLYSKWFARFQGEDKAGMPLITGPDIEVNSLGTIAPELFIQGDESISTHVLAAYGVPKTIVGISDSMTYGSVLAVQGQFCQFRINPMLTYYGQVMTEKIIHRTKGYEDGILHWKSRVPNDPAQVNADLQLDLAAYAVTSNEVRTIRGRPTYEHGGDEPVGDAKNMFNWATGKQLEQDQVLDLEAAAQLQEAGITDRGEDGHQPTPADGPVNGALSSSSGGAGGYLAGETEHVLAKARVNGRQLFKATGGYIPKWQRNGVH